MRKERIIRYVCFVVCIVALGMGVIFLITKNLIPAIVCLSIGVIAGVLFFIPYPFLKKEEENDEDPE